MSKRGSLIGFLVGSALGALIVWYLLRKNYLLRKRDETPKSETALKNKETWKLWEEEDGTICAEVHREVVTPAG